MWLINKEGTKMVDAKEIEFVVGFTPEICSIIDEKLDEIYKNVYNSFYCYDNVKKSYPSDTEMKRICKEKVDEWIKERGYQEKGLLYVDGQLFEIFDKNVTLTQAVDLLYYNG